jgi:CheY-like chemotaxis protein
MEEVPATAVTETTIASTHCDDQPELALPDAMHVLLVDDSVAACKLLQRRLTACKSDMVFVTASNGEAALLLCEAREEGFDLVVIDENMQSTGGVLLGHEVVQEMRHRLGMTRTAIIGCSGNAATCAEDFLASGADEVWSKPTPSVESMVVTICSIRQRLLSEAASRLPCGVSVAVIDDSKANSKLLVRRLST